MIRMVEEGSQGNLIGLAFDRIGDDVVYRHAICSTFPFFCPKPLNVNLFATLQSKAEPIHVINQNNASLQDTRRLRR